MSLLIFFVLSCCDSWMICRIGSLPRTEESDPEIKQPIATISAMMMSGILPDF